MNEKIKQALQDAQGLYYRLVLLVGKVGAGKSALLRQVSQELGTTVTNLNLELSEQLLELTSRQRTLELHKLLDSVVQKKYTPIILDNIEILFEQSLQNDALRLLQSVSRNKVILAAWNGTLNSGRLVYAEIGHQEYRCYDSPEALLIPLEDSDTISMVKHL